MGLGLGRKLFGYEKQREPKVWSVGKRCPKLQTAGFELCLNACQHKYEGFVDRLLRASHP